MQLGSYENYCLELVVDLDRCSIDRTRMSHQLELTHILHYLLLLSLRRSSIENPIRYLSQNIVMPLLKQL
jgi:hypothetical protein